MLRITVHETATALTFQLDGKLTGPWVRQLEAQLQRTLTSRNKPVLRLDLSGVTMIDEQGKDFLTLMHQDGAELLASGYLFSAIVSAIIDAPAPAGPGPD